MSKSNGTHWLLESKKPGDDGKPLYITHLYKDGVKSGFATTWNWYNASWFETREEARQAQKELPFSERKRYRPQQHTMSSNGMRKVDTFAQKVVDKFKETSMLSNVDGGEIRHLAEACAGVSRQASLE